LGDEMLNGDDDLVELAREVSVGNQCFSRSQRRFS
jgi:hypothetical protein